MTRYWSIAPWPNDEPEAFNHVWEYDQTHGVIVIGWDAVGDPTGLSRVQLAARFAEKAPDWRAGGQHQVWKFYNEIELDDVILARKGIKYCIGLGRVRSAAWLDIAEGKARIGTLAPGEVRSNFIRVEWQRPFRPVSVQHPFHQNTVNEVDPSQYSDVLRSLR